MGILDKIAKQVDWPDEQVGGWMGNGSYLCTCRVCKLYYTGVKHSSCCYPCAKAAIKKALEDLPEVSGSGVTRYTFRRGEPALPPVKEVVADFQRVANKFWPPPALEQEISDGMRKITHPGAPEPMFVEHWIGWHLGRDGKPAPIICDGNPGYLAHVTKYRFQVPPDVVEHLTGTRECLMLDKFGAMEKDCRS